MPRLIRMSMIDFRKFGHIVDKDQRRRNTNDGTFCIVSVKVESIIRLAFSLFLHRLSPMQGSESFLYKKGVNKNQWFTVFLNLIPQDKSLVPFEIMVGNPQSRYASPEWSGERGKGMEEAIVNELI